VSELDIDYSERAGFLTGKALALADWRHRKDKREFDVLQARLSARRWLMRVYAEGGEKLERVRELARKRANARKERRRLKRRGRVLTCGWCGAQWCPLPRAPGAAAIAKSCSARCQHAIWRSAPENRERLRKKKNAARGSTGLCWCGAPKPKGHGWRYCRVHSSAVRRSAREVRAAVTAIIAERSF
jgi:hypothetical protein